MRPPEASLVSYGDYGSRDDWRSGGYDLGAPYPGLAWDAQADGAGRGAWRFWHDGSRVIGSHFQERVYTIPGWSLSKCVVRLELHGQWRATGDVNAEAYGASVRLIVDREQTPTELDVIGVAAAAGPPRPGFLTWPRADTGGWQPFSVVKDVPACYPHAAMAIRLRLAGRSAAGGSQVWYVRGLNLRVVFTDGTEFSTLVPAQPAPLPAAPVWDEEERSDLGALEGRIRGNTMFVGAALAREMEDRWGGVLSYVKTATDVATGEVAVARALAGEPGAVPVRWLGAQVTFAFNFWRPLRKLGLKVPAGRQFVVAPRLLQVESIGTVFLFALNDRQSLPRADQGEAEPAAPGPC